MNDGKRRSLNVLFRLGGDNSATATFAATVLCRRKPLTGLGGPWRRESVSVCAAHEHEARRLLLTTYLRHGYTVRAIVIDAEV